MLSNLFNCTRMSDC